MTPFRLTSYNVDTQRLDFELNHPIEDGYLIIKDIDLKTTIYKLTLKDFQPPSWVFVIPCPKSTFDFEKSDFGGFTFDLIDNGELIHQSSIRFRFPQYDKPIVEYKDYYHPIFMNYREFFVDDMYSSFDLGNRNIKKVIDCGASVGLFTKYMLRHKANEVICVEPDARSVQALNDNYFGRSNINIVPKALSNYEGLITLYTSENNPIISSLDLERSEATEGNEVACTTLERVFRESGWDNVDLLKIDIEGSEYGVVDATSDDLFNRTQNILLEYHWHEGRLVSIIDRLSSLGFKYKFLPGCSLDTPLGTIFFYK